MLEFNFDFRFGNMEKQNGYENSLELILRNFGGNVNNDFAKSGDDLNQQNWFGYQRAPSNYYGIYDKRFIACS